VEEQAQQQIIHVTFDGDEYSLDKVGVADLVAFERKFKVRSDALAPKPTGEYDEDGNAIMQAEVFLEWIAFLLWRSLRRQGVIEKSVDFTDEFLERIDGVRFESPAVQDVDPTEEGQQPG
jgi:hypothetical protein